MFFFIGNGLLQHRSCAAQILLSDLMEAELIKYILEERRNPGINIRIICEALADSLQSFQKIIVQEVGRGLYTCRRISIFCTEQILEETKLFS